MTEFNMGDKVRVTYEAEIKKTRPDSVGGGYYVNPTAPGLGGMSVPRYATVELIEPVDDPSRDPVGTVRKNLDPHGNGPLTKFMSDGWVVATANPGGSSALPDRYVANWGGPIIGAVPGTPAWDAWSKGLLCGAPEFPGSVQQRELWTGDGSEEPPAHVTKVLDGDGDVAYRTPSGRWSYSEAAGGGWAWSGNGSFGPYAEVVD